MENAQIRGDGRCWFILKEITNMHELKFLKQSIYLHLGEAAQSGVFHATMVTPGNDTNS